MLRKITFVSILCFMTAVQAKTFKLKGDIHVDGFAYKMHHLVDVKVKVVEGNIKTYTLNIENFHKTKVAGVNVTHWSPLGENYFHIVFEGKHMMKSKTMLNGNMMDIKMECVLPFKKKMNLTNIDFTPPVVDEKTIFNPCIIESTYSNSPRVSNHWFKTRGTLVL